MPCFDSPNTVLNSCKGELFRRLRMQHGYKAGNIKTGEINYQILFIPLPFPSSVCFLLF